MLRIHTGKPGSGKTLYTLWWVERYRKKIAGNEQELRPVYQHGIPELTLDWHELTDPKTWHTMPQGSIIVIDEAQYVFPVMSGAAKRPDYYTAIDMHRHRGHDLILLTQNADLIDIRFRSMCAAHVHIVRNFQLERAVVYEWQDVHKTLGRDLSKVRDAVITQWAYPKEVYNWYRSSREHTTFDAIPWKKILPAILAIVFAITAVVYGVLWLFRLKSDILNGGDDIQVTQHETSPEQLQTQQHQENSDAETYYWHDPRIDGCYSAVIGTDVECECIDANGYIIDDIHVPECMAYLGNPGLNM